MAGTLVIDTLTDGSGNSTSATNAIRGSAKAWVNFNGSTTPPTILASHNVSSVTISSTGRFTVNFSTALTDSNYSFTAGIKGSGTYTNTAIYAIQDDGSAKTTTQFGVVCGFLSPTGGSVHNPPSVCLSFDR